MKIDTQNFRPCVSFKLTLTTFLGKVLFVLKFLGQNGLKMCPKMVYASERVMRVLKHALFLIFLHENEIPAAEKLDIQQLS